VKAAGGIGSKTHTFQLRNQDYRVFTYQLGAEDSLNWSPNRLGVEFMGWFPTAGGRGVG